MGYSYYYEPSLAGHRLDAILAVFGVFVFVVALMLLILRLIAHWKLFQKAGQPGWKALIPVYSEYTLYGIAWKKSMFWVAFAVELVSSIPGSILSSAFTQMSVAGGVSVANVAGTAVGVLLLIACIVVNMVIQIMLSVHLSRSFGHGGGYAVGLILLPDIFMLILGLGTSQYHKKNEQPIVSQG